MGNSPVFHWERVKWLLSLVNQLTVLRPHSASTSFFESIFQSSDWEIINRPLPPASCAALLTEQLKFLDIISVSAMACHELTVCTASRVWRMWTSVLEFSGHTAVGADRRQYSQLLCIPSCCKCTISLPEWSLPHLQWSSLKQFCFLTLVWDIARNGLRK